MLKVVEKQDAGEAGEELLLLDEIAQGSAADADGGAEGGVRRLRRARMVKVFVLWRPGGWSHLSR